MNISIVGQLAAIGGSGGGGGGINPPAGQIGGTAVNPTVVGITESGGPTQLGIGAISDGEFLVRSGTNVVGAASPVTFAAVNAALGTANASISVNSQKITNLADGTSAGDAVNRGQLDGKASTSHASTHQAGQSDALSGNLDATARVTVRKNSGVNVGSRRRINFVEGSNITLTVADDAGNEEVDVEIASSGGGGSGITELTGDVTAGPGSGSQAATIAANVVSNTKLADVATATFKGRVTAGSGDPEDLTGTQATTLLDTFTTSLKGLAPASGGGTSNFLRADGTWAAPGGGGSPGGSTTQVQYNNAGAFAGATNVEIENDNLRLENISTPSTPASGGSNVYGKTLAGFSRVAYLPANATEMYLQPGLTSRMISWVRPIVGTAAPSTFGLGASATGTQTAATWAITNQHQSSQRNEYLVTAAAATAVAGVRAGTVNCWIGSAAGLGGFLFNARWGPATGVATATSRAFFGLRAATGAPTDVNPSTLVSCIGMGYDSADTNIQIMHNDSSGTCTKIDLGASFPVPTADRTAVYEITLGCLPNASSVDYLVTNVSSGATASGTISTDLPANTAGLGYLGYCSAGGTSSVIGLALMRVYLETFT